MHDELRAFGVRRMRWWIAVLLLVGAVAGAALATFAALDPEWPPTDAGLGGGPATVGVGALAGLTVVVVLLVAAGDARSGRRAWPTCELAPAPDLVGLVDGAAIARGEPVPRVWRLASGAPNVACLPGPAGRHLVVSTAAEQGFARDELEALGALQFSLLLDGSARRVRRALIAASRLITWILGAGLLALLVVLVRHPLWAGLTINLAVWLPLILIAGAVVVQRRLRWSWGIVGDGVAVETTRHPEPLIRALRRLAGYNGEQVPVRRTFGASDPFWAAPVRRHVGIATMVVNNRARSRRSTEQVSDATLLLRAGIVERVCIAGDPATVASWRSASATFTRLGRYGGDHAADSIDGTVDGVLVTTDGAAGGPGPVGGSWPVPPHSPPSGRRPWRPHAAALAAYDAVE